MPEQVRTEIEDASSYVTTHEQPADNGKAALDAAIDATQQNPSLDDFTAAKVMAAASFKLDEPRGHHLYWVACNGRHQGLADARMKRLQVVDWITYMKEVIRKDGSIDENGMVTCLFLSNGQTVSWASATTNRQWCAVVKIKGKGPYDPPCEIVLIPNASDDKDKGPWYSILPFNSPEANKAIMEWKERE